MSFTWFRDYEATEYLLEYEMLDITGTSVEPMQRYHWLVRCSGYDGM